MSHHNRGIVCVMIVLIGLGACTQIDPLTSAGRWRPVGANDANLAQQIVNPTDLIGGQGVESGDGVQAVAAIARLRHDQVKSLDEGAAPAPPISFLPPPTAPAAAGAN